MGSLYPRGGIWWVKYYENGRPRRESTGTTKATEARRFLKEREGRVATGQPTLQRADRIGYEEVAQDLRQHYQTTGSRNLEEAEYRLKHLARFYTGQRIAAIGSDRITSYIVHRQEEGASNATINREMATLSKMLRLAHENQKLLRLPIIRKLKENAPRQGFFEREKYEAVRGLLQLDYQVTVAIAHTYGWRMQSEVLTLEWRQIDLETGTVRLDPGTTKNDEGRVVYLTPELKSFLVVQLERVRALEREMRSILPYLFPHLRGPHKGRRIQDFKRAWRAACVKAGCPGMLRHDFRRTAIRNMVNIGVPDSVFKKFAPDKTAGLTSGHEPPKTLPD